MEVAGFLLGFGLVFGAILSLGFWRVWRLYRVIAVVIPSGTDPQAFRYKLTEAIRSFRYRESVGTGPMATFRAPAWQKWAVGLQDISVEPAGAGAVLIAGPAFNVSRIARVFAGAAVRPYNGRQPFWPLVKGLMRIFAVLIVLLAASGLAAYLAGA